MKTKVLALFLCLSTSLAIGQTKSVLFIGNSYTGVNNLPQLTKDVALSAGDTLIYDSHTPGGAQMQQHATSAAAMQKIFSQHWDHVVLQAQSQEPSFNPTYVQQNVFPYAANLCDSIRSNNSCTRPIFYRTWGRKNGDASNCSFAPWLCTYEGMDSALAYSYRVMADSNEAYLSPVGEVWKYLRTNYPSMVLYAADESHPSLAGSYAAACAFYTIIFQKDPSLILYDAGLNASDAQWIRSAAETVVYDSLPKWNVGKYKMNPQATFNYTTLSSTPCTIGFDASGSINAASYYWDFGDGNFDTTLSPSTSHTYTTGGSKSVKLTVENCGETDDTTIVLGNPCIVGLSENSVLQNIRLFPNPAENVLSIENFENENLKELVLINPNGQIIRKYSKNIPSQIDISNLSTGLYTLQFKLESGFQFSKSFIKN